MARATHPSQIVTQNHTDSRSCRRVSADTSDSEEGLETARREARFTATRCCDVLIRDHHSLTALRRPRQSTHANDREAPLALAASPTYSAETP